MKVTRRPRGAPRRRPASSAYGPGSAGRGRRGGAGSALFLLTGNSGDMVRLQPNGIRAAASAGVESVVKLEDQRAGGPTGRTTDTVETVTGRLARTFGPFARDHAEDLAG